MGNMLGLSSGIKISILSKSGHRTFVLSTIIIQSQYVNDTVHMFTSHQ